MRVRLNQNIIVDASRFLAGAVVDLSDEVARSLSREGLAVALEAPPAPTTTAPINKAKTQGKATKPTDKSAPKRTRKTVKE